jgi:superfamily II DNA helicase RecQ
MVDRAHSLHLAAAPYGTVKFTSPLYRKNLHYQIVSKPSVSAQLVKDMMNYILERHPNETGIVYCLSRLVSDSAQLPIGIGQSLCRTRSGSRLICLI